MLQSCSFCLDPLTCKGLKEGAKNKSSEATKRSELRHSSWVGTKLWRTEAPWSAFDDAGQCRAAQSDADIFGCSTFLSCIGCIWPFFGDCIGRIWRFLPFFGHIWSIWSNWATCPTFFLPIFALFFLTKVRLIKSIWRWCCCLAQMWGFRAEQRGAD